MTSSCNLQSIFEWFDTGQPASKEGEVIVSINAYGSGHINDTFKVITNRRCYILQRINNEVFTRPVEVMDNIRRVTQHLAEKIAGQGGDPTRETLTLYPSKREVGESSLLSSSSAPPSWYVFDNGNYWRLYNFISDTITYEIGEGSSDQIGGLDHIREAAAAFARFQRDVADIPLPRLHETIPGFGDTSFRMKQFKEALAADVCKRAKDCYDEIEFALARRADASKLMDLLKNGAIPERIVHYDTKINNVLIDKTTGRGLCVIDLDTVMPGLALYDFGDCVRAATALSVEDETDLDKVGMDIEKFELLAEGYISEAREFLTEIEIDQLAFAARMVTFTIGLRFLTDHLEGDVYFKTQRANHNLDRCRTQFKTVADMERLFDEMKAIVNKYRKR